MDFDMQFCAANNPFAVEQRDGDRSFAHLFCICVCYFEWKKLQKRQNNSKKVIYILKKVIFRCLNDLSLNFEFLNYLINSSLCLSLCVYDSYV